MCGRIFVWAMLMTLGVMGTGGTIFAQGAKPGTAPPPSETTELIGTMQLSIETKNFTNAMTLKEATQLLHEMLAARGKEMSVLINAAAFRNLDMPEPDNANIQLPDLPRKLPVLAVIEQFTSQARATYLLRRGCIEIVPVEYGAIASLLSQSVTARYDNQPLREVLQDLADQTGATIVLDPRAAEPARELISAVLRNNATLEDALRICTETAGLKFVVLRNSVYVTTPANARQIRKELLEDPPPPPAPRSDSRSAA